MEIQVLLLLYFTVLDLCIAEGEDLYHSTQPLRAIVLFVALSLDIFTTKGLLPFLQHPILVGLSLVVSQQHSWKPELLEVFLIQNNKISLIQTVRVLVAQRDLHLVQLKVV